MSPEKFLRRALCFGRGLCSVSRMATNEHTERYPRVVKFNPYDPDDDDGYDRMRDEFLTSGGYRPPAVWRKR